MNGTSYLLAIDGSQEARSTAYFAWKLAKKTGARVVAQHVVDTAAVWRFLDYDLAGFIGSGVYMDAREQMIAAMYAIGESLMLSYVSQVSGQPLECENYIDEGDPATEIAGRAKSHDIVMVGNRRRDATSVRLRMFEKLADTSTCPVFVVGNAARQWSKMQLFVDSDSVDTTDISGIRKLGTELELPTEIYIDTNVAEKQDDLHLMGVRSRASQSLQRSGFNELITSAPEDILLVVPADMVKDRQNVGYRAHLRAFLDQSEKRGLLLWTHKSPQKAIRLAS